MVGHHQRPGRERHELPGDKEGEGVIGQDDEVHAGQKRGIEREHASGCFLVLAVADGKKARRRSSEVGDSEKKRGERVHAKMCADPR